ncbi:multidrug resistance efflux transporter family protein [Tamlana sp. 62-3]|uniref:Multidrug resistance efflux transporter family protein n=1 Tax=Neotamlana sargassicola TaxID=2883125 RepID=A0A9X1I7T0_9FLAO|nr:multidrug resistance efflux transporter family protein [Tamlana sargassicola]MCB4808842.1 multidrug resistance efflux transporter family protein [Tamlana sargassicola]
MKSNKSLAIVLGVLSALFFAVTFVLNRLISVGGGHWIWSSSLRFFWMIPLLLVLVCFNKNLKPLLKVMREKPWQWLIWSTIGFGVFYAPLTFAAAYGPSWLVASTWQITIVAGMLVAPIINKKSFKKSISLQALTFSLIILLGILIMQISQAQSISTNELLLGTIPVLIAAFAYPLGNRKMMQVTNGKLNAIQRTLGMTLGSLPFWILLSIIGININELPTETQVYQTSIVAICSGVIATVLFFMATDKVQKNEKALASVEATQSAEVLFALVGEILVLKIHLPDIYSIIGIILVIVGMMLHSFKKEKSVKNSA